MKLNKKQKIRCLLWVITTIVIASLYGYIGVTAIEKLIS